MVARVGRGEDCHQAKAWNCLDQDVQSFAVSLAREHTDARCIGVRPRYGVHETGPEQIGSDRNDRNGFRRLLKGSNPFPATTIASTRALTSSATDCEIRSTFPYVRNSTVRFWPSTKPRRRSSSKKR